MNKKRPTPVRRDISKYLVLWRKYPSIADCMLCCAAISAQYRHETEFFTWAVRWLTTQPEETV